MLKRKKYIDEITTKLGWIKSEVSLRTSLNLLDLNIHMEHFVLGLLNLTYGYQLENLNTTQTNYASIDLGDSSRRIAIQITSDNDSQKIKETLSRFFERKYNEKYDRVIVLIIGDKKKYTTSFAVPDGFNFSKDTDIWDFTTLVKDISQKETTELHQIASYFEQELAPVAGYVGSGVYSIAEEMKNKTRALSVAKLMTPGLSKEVAEKIIKADIASNKYQYILDEVSQGKHYLVGGYGSGKSHAALVLCQRLLEQYTVGAFDALPMYTHVRDIVSAGSIQSWVDKKTTNNKYILFIDGLDEISYSIASQITEEVLYLSALKPENALIVCSRPLTYLPDKTNQISVQPLSVAEQEELIGFISDEDAIKFFPHTIEPDLKSCIEIPLFCIIYALLKGTGKLGWVKNKIDLLTAFIDNSTKRIVELNSDLYKDLTAISICATNNGYCDVHISEVTLTSSIDEILKTGLVEKQGEYVFFPLIIIAQFLAAKALQDNAVDRKTVSSSRASIERWRYPISILFSQASFDDTFSFFSEVFYSAPGLAAQIIKDGIKTEKNHSLPNAHLCGEKIVACMNAWTNILGDLSEYIVPTNHGELKTLGIHSEKTYLSYAWYESKNRDSIIEYPSVNSMFGVGTIHSQPVAAQSTWPWIITFEMISRTLQENIDAQTILADCCQLNKEAFWETASLLLNRGSLNFSNINTDQFEHLRGIPGKVIN